jgi:hypothetical protein
MIITASRWQNLRSQTQESGMIVEAVDPAVPQCLIGVDEDGHLHLMLANVWECSLRGVSKLPDGEVLKKCFDFLVSEEVSLIDVSGKLITNDE